MALAPVSPLPAGKGCSLPAGKHVQREPPSDACAFPVCVCVCVQGLPQEGGIIGSFLLSPPKIIPSLQRVVALRDGPCTHAIPGVPCLFPARLLHAAAGPRRPAEPFQCRFSGPPNSEFFLHHAAIPIAWPSSSAEPCPPLAQLLEVFYSQCKLFAGKSPVILGTGFFSTRPVNTLHPSPVPWAPLGAQLPPVPGPRGGLPCMPGASACVCDGHLVFCRPVGTAMERLNPCGSKAGEYMGKTVLSAPRPGSRGLLSPPH